MSGGRKSWFVDETLLITSKTAEALSLSGGARQSQRMLKKGGSVHGGKLCG